MITQTHTPLDPTTIARKLDQATAAAITTYSQALTEYDMTLATIANLGATGITNATPHYRDQKYLYLIHPTASDGTRRREYIGADPARQADALARIARWTDHQTAIALANRQTARLTAIFQKLNSISNGGYYENL